MGVQRQTPWGYGPQRRQESDYERSQYDADSIADLSSAGKAIAMLLYSDGAVSFERTQAVFNAHPNWRDA